MDAGATTTRAVGLLGIGSINGGVALCGPWGAEDTVAPTPPDAPAPAGTPWGAQPAAALRVRLSVLRPIWVCISVTVSRACSAHRLAIRPVSSA